MDAATRPDWLTLTCRSVPTQIEGTTPDGERVYFRFRFGSAALWVEGALVWDDRYGHDYSGDMDPDLAIAIITTQLAARGTPEDDPARLAARAAHEAAREALPLGDVPPLTDQEQALMDRWTAVTPPAQD